MFGNENRKHRLKTQLYNKERGNIYFAANIFKRETLELMVEMLLLRARVCYLNAVTEGTENNDVIACLVQE